MASTYCLARDRASESASAIPFLMASWIVAICRSSADFGNFARNKHMNSQQALSKEGALSLINPRNKIKQSTPTHYKPSNLLRLRSQIFFCYDRNQLWRMNVLQDGPQTSKTSNRRCHLSDKSTLTVRIIRIHTTPDEAWQAKKDQSCETKFPHESKKNLHFRLTITFTEFGISCRRTGRFISAVRSHRISNVSARNLAKDW